MDEQLIIGVEICLDDVDLFLQLFGDLDNLVFSRPASDRVFMYTIDTGCRDIQTLDIHLATCEHCRHLIKDAGNVFTIY